MSADTSSSPSRQLTVERLGKHHDRKSFVSGVAELDEYFRKQAGQDARNGVAAPFVLADPLEGQVAGYYTLSATTIPANQLPAAMARRLPRYPEMPATLLGRLAVDRRHQGKGYGDLLLTDALLRSLQHSEQIASFAVMVDAKGDKARSFYEHYRFVRFLINPYRLFLPMKTIKESLEEPG